MTWYRFIWLIAAALFFWLARALYSEQRIGAKVQPTASPNINLPTGGVTIVTHQPATVPQRMLLMNDFEGSIFRHRLRY